MEEGNTETINYIGIYKSDFLHKYFTFKFCQASYVCYFDLPSFINAAYQDERLYCALQPLWCALFDVALSVGTTEAIAESAYSSLAHHVKAGNQHNATAANR